MITVPSAVGQTIDFFNILLIFVLTCYLLPTLRNGKTYFVSIFVSLTLSYLDLDFNILSEIVMPFIFLLILQYNKVSKLFRRILLYLVITVTILVSDGVSDLIVNRWFDLLTQNGTKYIGFMLVLIITSYFSALVIVALGKCIFELLAKQVDITSKFISRLLGTFIGLLSFGVVTVVYVSRLLHKQMLLLTTNMITISLIFIFLMISMIFYVNGYLKTIKADQELKQIKENEKYVQELEKSYAEARKFRHDYKNLLISLSSVLADESNNSAYSIVNRLLLDSNAQKQEQTIANPNLYTFEDKMVQGILVSKIISAQNEKLDVNLEVEPNMPAFGVVSLILMRILGILFDNALEAAQVTADKFLRVAITREDQIVEFIIENSYLDKNLSVTRMFENGYSTKSGHSGIGLATVKELVSKQDNIFLETELADTTYTVVLTYEMEA